MIVRDVKPKSRQYATRPRGFSDLNNYVQRGEPGERIAFTATRNIEFNATLEMEAVAAQAPRVKDPTLHLVISWANDERPTNEQMLEAAERVLAEAGLSEHQAVIAGHVDTEHYHVHISLNRIHPETHKAVAFVPYSQFQKTSRALEQEHGWQYGGKREVGAHDRMPMHARAADFERRTGEPSFQRWATESGLAEALRAARDGAGTWEAIHGVCEQYGVRYVPYGGGAAIVRSDDPSYRAKASHLGRDLAMTALEKKIGSYQEPAHTPTQPCSYATSSSRSFSDYAVNTVAPAVHQAIYAPATSWGNVRAVLREHGCDLRPAGGGMQIFDVDHPERSVKLSSLGSFARTASLRSRLGNPDEPHKRVRGDSYIDSPSEAINALLAENSTATLADIERFAFRNSADRAQARQLINAIVTSDRLVRVGFDDNARERFSTREILNTELRLRKYASVLSSQEGGFAVSRRNQNRALHKQKYELDEGQRRAFTALMRGGRYCNVIGAAGAGKTSFLEVSADAWRRQGFKVVGAALSSGATAELRAATINSRTIASALHAWDPEVRRQRLNDIRLATHRVEQRIAYVRAMHEPRNGWRNYKAPAKLPKTSPTQKRLANAVARALTPQRLTTWQKVNQLETTLRQLRSKAYEVEQASLDSRTVVVIDEAGMVGSGQLARLLEIAHDAGAKVVLTGDPRQLQPIERGGAFYSLTKEFGAVELTENHRQRVDWQKEATALFRDGRAREALHLYEQHGRVHEFAGDRDAKVDLVARWFERKEADPTKDAIILAHSRRDVRDLNHAIHEIRRDRGEVDAKEHRLDTEHFGQISVSRGDRLVFRKVDHDLGVRNGEIGTITNVRGSHVTVELDRKANWWSGAERVTFDARDYRSFGLGYANTVHSSQGQTKDHALVYVSEGFDRHLSYVAGSRHRHDAEFFWARERLGTREALYFAVQRDNTKGTTLDAKPERSREAPAPTRNNSAEGYRRAHEATRAGRAPKSRLAAEYARDRRDWKRTWTDLSERQARDRANLQKNSQSRSTGTNDRAMERKLLREEQRTERRDVALDAPRESVTFREYVHVRAAAGDAVAAAVVANTAARPERQMTRAQWNSYFTPQPATLAPDAQRTLQARLSEPSHRASLTTDNERTTERKTGMATTTGYAPAYLRDELERLGISYDQWLDQHYARGADSAQGVQTLYAADDTRAWNGVESSHGLLERYETNRVDETTVQYKDESGRVAFTDHGNRIGGLKDASEQDLTAAVQLAKEKWGEKGMHISGSDEFKERVLREAVKQGVTVTNPELQKRQAELQREYAAERTGDISLTTSPGIDREQLGTYASLDDWKAFYGPGREAMAQDTYTEIRGRMAERDVAFYQNLGWTRDRAEAEYHNVRMQYDLPRDRELEQRDLANERGATPQQLDADRKADAFAKATDRTVRTPERGETVEGRVAYVAQRDDGRASVLVQDKAHPHEYTKVNVRSEQARQLKDGEAVRLRENQVEQQRDRTHEVERVQKMPEQERTVEHDH